MDKYFNLSSDLRIPRIINGLWQIADMERNDGILDPAAAAKHLNEYGKKGFNAFDMADHYGSSEIIAGVYKNEFEIGKEAKLFTKWVPKAGKISQENVKNAVQKSLDRMQQESIDLMQFHAWQYAEPSWIDALTYLTTSRKKGQIKEIGLTNFDHSHLRIALASGLPIVSNQISYSLLDRRADEQMRDVCMEFGVKLLVFGTLAGGFLTDKWLGVKEPEEDKLSNWSQMKYKRYIDEAGGWQKFQNLLETLKKVAVKHDASIANISTRMLFENEAVGGIIIGIRPGENNHIQNNQKIFEIDLDQEDISMIREAQNMLKDIPGNCGDEYRKPPFLTASGDLSHHLESFPKIYETIRQNSKDHVFSGTSWEEIAGFSRAVKKGNRVYISGTTSTHENRLVGGNDPAAQTHFIIDKIESVVTSFGGELKDIVRTRVYVRNIGDWEAVAKAHGERFIEIQPANTLVQANLVGEEYLVEIEAEAIL